MQFFPSRCLIAGPTEANSLYSLIHNKAHKTLSIMVMCHLIRFATEKYCHLLR
jgi:hypothetical protein